ncbi:MAG TPA: hypothetical protein VMW52_12585 [Phycisphaerae bacterium]|nr:hypothetical protein [Phycisphaerae bacterium]
MKILAGFCFALAGLWVLGLLVGIGRYLDAHSSFMSEAVLLAILVYGTLAFLCSGLGAVALGVAKLRDELRASWFLRMGQAPRDDASSALDAMGAHAAR